MKGSRGIVQAGQLLAFHELGLDYDMIFSSSVGTLGGLMYHADNLNELIELWLNLKTSDVYMDRGIIDFLLCYKRKYLHNSLPLLRTLEENINFAGVYSNPRDMYINTTDITNKCSYTREVKTLKPEELVKFALASASPPVHFPLVEFEGRTLCDSGVVDNFGIIDAVSAGCTTLIMLLPAKLSIGPLNNIADLLGAIIALSMNCTKDKETRCVSNINQVDSDRIKLIAVCPEENPEFGFLDFDYKGIDREELINKSYENAKKALSCLK